MFERWTTVGLSLFSDRESKWKRFYAHDSYLQSNKKLEIGKHVRHTVAGLYLLVLSAGDEDPAGSVPQGQAVHLNINNSYHDIL